MVVLWMELVSGVSDADETSDVLVANVVGAEAAAVLLQRLLVPWPSIIATIILLPVTPWHFDDTVGTRALRALTQLTEQVPEVKSDC